MNKILVVFFSLILIACKSTPEPTYDYNPDIDFSKFSTFKLTENFIKDDPDHNPIFNTNVAKALTAELTNQPLTLVTENEDISATFYVQYSQEHNNSSISFGIGGSSFGGNTSTGVSVGTSVPIENSTTIVHLIVDMSHDGVAVWHGRGQYEKPDNGNSAAEQQLITQTLQKILANYPPQPKQPK